MRKLLIPFLFLATSAGAQLTDDFSDGDYLNNPPWGGDTAKFEVDLSLRLHLNAPAVSDVACLSTPSAAIDNASWEFLVEMTFNPSASNFARVYLAADSANLCGQVNGYFVKIGNSTDEVSLYRQDGLTETEIIDGVDGRVNLANVSVRVRVTRDSTGLWTLSSDSTGGSNFLPEGSASDITYFQSSFFGMQCTYTSTRSTKFWFDDINVSGQAYIDSVPPAINSLLATGNNTLDVHFTEFVEKTSAETTGNYIASSGIGTPSSAVRDLVDSSIVHLTFGNQFGNAVYRTLTVSNVDDIYGNTLSADSAQFIWFIHLNPSARAVVINEILADPSPQVGMPPKEFVELYNADTNAYDLEGWQFTDGSSVSTLPPLILTPGDYLILCSMSDTGYYINYPKLQGLYNWPTLNNSGDSLRLMDSTGFVVDLLPYTDDWYHDANKKDGGWTLEQINPLHPCSGETNWQASLNLSGGTPGMQNSVYDTTADAQPPLLLQISVLNPNKVYVTFNEKMDSASTVNASYVIQPGISVTQVVPGSYLQSATLYLSPSLDSATAYTLYITGAEDCYHNAMEDSMRFGIGIKPALFDALIDEIMADPEPATGLPEKEYVEIFNNTSALLNMEGCIFTDGSDTAFFGKSLVFPADYLILCNAGDEGDFSGYGDVYGLNGFPSLNNAGDPLQLLAPDSSFLHGVTYSSAWYDDDIKSDGGWSLEMIDPANPCAGNANWKASEDAAGGTPGSQNSVNGSNPDTSPPRLLRADAGDATHLQLTFDEVILKNTAENATYSIDNGMGLSQVFSYGDQYVYITLSNAMQAGVTYSISVQGLNDCAENNIADNTAVFGLPETPGQGELIINEVLFNPRGTGADFVELYNNSNRFINLENWQLTSFDMDSISDAKEIAPFPFELPPQHYLLLSSDTLNIITEYPPGQRENFWEMSSLPPYNNQEGTIVVADGSGTIFDRFDYREDMHYPLLNSAEGVSLERLDFNRPTNESDNWHSAAQSVGFATPGYKNSQFIQPEGGSGFSVSPEVFSPDNDGLNDVVSFSYRFDKTGYVGNLLIYDPKGRLVRKLVQNELLGTSGSFSWDGINDNNERASTGIYIIFFEAFSEDGDVQRYKEKCVLASRL